MSLSCQLEVYTLEELTGVLRLCCFALLLHTDQGHGNLLEQAFHVVSCLRRRLHEHNVQLSRFRVCLLQRYLPVARDIRTDINSLIS